MRIPAHPAALHRARRLHRLGELVAEMHVEGPAIEMLAVFGDTDIMLGQHRVGLRRAVGRQDRGACLADFPHNPGEKIYDPDIDVDLFTAMKIAQELRKLLHRSRDRPRIVAVDAAERLAGMRIAEIEPVRSRWRWR